MAVAIQWLLGNINKEQSSGCSDPVITSKIKLRSNPVVVCDRLVMDKVTIDADAYSFIVQGDRVNPVTIEMTS